MPRLMQLQYLLDLALFAWAHELYTGTSFSALLTYMQCLTPTSTPMTRWRHPSGDIR